jgi:uncharacterized SAM-binding protein YcdF (DUF218 family)
VFDEKRVNRAIVVTSRDHVARASAIFAVIFSGTEIQLHVIPVPDYNSSRDSVAKEVKSFLPSVAAAVVARLTPSFYEWIRPIMPYIRLLYDVRA